MKQFLHIMSCVVCLSSGCCRRSWRLMFLCLLPRAPCEHTELCCWPEVLALFMDTPKKTPPSFTCLTMTWAGWAISLGRWLLFGVSAFSTSVSLIMILLDFYSFDFPHYNFHLQEILLSKDLRPFSCFLGLDNSSKFLDCSNLAL